MSYPWVKTLHIVLIMAWFAGLFYLPRIFCAIAQATHAQTRLALYGMAKRLLRFTTLIAVPAVVLGVWLFGVFGIGMGPNGGWLHAKVFFVVLTAVFHFSCFIVLLTFEGGKPGVSECFCRRFSYIPMVLLVVIVALAVLKPF